MPGIGTHDAQRFPRDLHRLSRRTGDRPARQFPSIMPPAVRGVPGRLQPGQFADCAVDQRRGARFGRFLSLAPGRLPGLDRARKVADDAGRRTPDPRATRPASRNAGGRLKRPPAPRDDPSGPGRDISLAARATAASSSPEVGPVATRGSIKPVAKSGTEGRLAGAACAGNIDHSAVISRTTKAAGRARTGPNGTER